MSFSFQSHIFTEDSCGPAAKIWLYKPHAAFFLRILGHSIGRASPLPFLPHVSSLSLDRRAFINAVSVREVDASITLPLLTAHRNFQGYLG